MYAFKNTKKHISFFLLFSSACASAPRLQPLPSAHFDARYQYQVKTADQKITSISPQNIQRKNQNLLIQEADRELVIPLNQVQKIEGKSLKKTGSYAWQGAMIGGLAGGLTMGLGVGLAGTCSGHGGYSEDCNSLKTPAVIGFTALGVALGGGLGLGIGAFIPKKDKILISPNMDSRGNFGGNVSFQKEF